MEEQKITGAKQLLASIDEFLGKYADNIALMAKGHKTKFELDDTMTTKVLKMVDQAANIDTFNKILTGEYSIPETKKGRPATVTTVKETTIEEKFTDENAFEARNKAIKAKANATNS